MLESHSLQPYCERRGDEPGVHQSRRNGGVLEEAAQYVDKRQGDDRYSRKAGLH